MTFGPAWYPVALSNAIEAGRSAGTRLFDQELCIWRDTKGMAHAWEDRCPHRGMRLSFGFVRGDRIACLYHGWQYDRLGQCRLIPAHPDLEVPDTIRVAKYFSQELLGMLWVYSAREAATPPVLALDEREVTLVRSLYVECAPASVMQALAAPSKIISSAGATVLSLDADGQTVLAGLQPFGRSKTALHLVLASAPATGRAAARHAVAFWAEGLRRLLEQEANLSATMKRATTHEAAL
jgi:nitrite reductase/ring-hydroxylating ferredoxin subunit